MVFIGDIEDVEDTGHRSKGKKSKREVIETQKAAHKKQHKNNRATALNSVFAALLGQREEDLSCGFIAEVSSEHIKKTIKYDNSDVLQINISYPCLKLKVLKSHESIIKPKILEKAEKKFNTFYGDIVRNFVKFAETEIFRGAANEYIIKKTKEADNHADETEYERKYTAPFRAFGTVMNYEITYNRGGLLCVYFDTNIYTGKGRGRIVRTANIWRLPEGTFAKPGQFIDFGRDGKKKICSRICDIIDFQAERGEQDYIDPDFRRVYRHLKAKNMYITDRGCVFFFPQNSLSPSECGIVSFIYS